MARMFVIVCSLVAAASCAVLPAHQVEAEAPAHYEFSYSVHDPASGDIKQQQESRHGDAVQGSYSLVEADGTRRIVHYTADAEHGFNAVVSHEGEPQPQRKLAYAAPVAKLAYAAPIAKVSYAQPAPVYAAPITKLSYAAPVTKHIYTAPVAKLAYAAPVAKLAYAQPAPVYAAPAAKLAYAAPAAKVAYPAPATHFSYSSPIISYHH